MKLYWTKGEFCRLHFYTSVMTRDRFLRILKYLHFEHNQNPPTENRKYPDYYRLWKNHTNVFDILNLKYSELYHPTEHIAVVEVIVKFKGKSFFGSTLKKYKQIWHKKFINFVTALVTYMT
jgi:hypothetical protein